MSEVNMFEKASRLNLTISTSKGMIGVNDLWRLPLAKRNSRETVLCLDDIAKDLYQKLKNADEISFVEPKSGADDVVALQFEIVKYIIDIRLKEIAARDEREKLAEERRKILELISRKKEEQLSSLSLEELTKRLAEMTQ